MKKIIAVVIAIILSLSMAALAESSEESMRELEENEILMHGYINPYTDYYVGVPADWFIIGTGSTQENLSEASEGLADLDVYSFHSQLSKDNDVLYCVSKDGVGLILTYGESVGVTNNVLIDSMEELQKELTDKYPGIVFTEDSGKYSYKSIAEILHIGMNYKNRRMDQYYLVSGTNTYLFTFFGTDTSIAETVLSTFAIR